jgi:hypothetical protein
MLILHHDLLLIVLSASAPTNTIFQSYLTQRLGVAIGEIQQSQGTFFVPGVSDLSSCVNLFVYTSGFDSSQPDTSTFSRLLPATKGNLFWTTITKHPYSNEVLAHPSIGNNPSLLFHHLDSVFHNDPHNTHNIEHIRSMIHHVIDSHHKHSPDL